MYSQVQWFLRAKTKKNLLTGIGNALVKGEGEERLGEFTKVNFQDSRNRSAIFAVDGVGKVYAFLIRVEQSLEVHDLSMTSRHTIDSLAVQPYCSS